MTAKKAVKIIDRWLAQKQISLKELKGEESEMIIALQEFEKTAIKNLQAIRKELVPNCIHAKDMIDCADGQHYCMACNWDLDKEEIALLA